MDLQELVLMAGAGIVIGYVGSAVLAPVLGIEHHAVKPGCPASCACICVSGKPVCKGNSGCPCSGSCPKPAAPKPAPSPLGFIAPGLNPSATTSGPVQPAPAVNARAAKTPVPPKSGGGVVCSGPCVNGFCLDKNTASSKPCPTTNFTVPPGSLQPPGGISALVPGLGQAIAGFQHRAGHNWVVSSYAPVNANGFKQDFVVQQDFGTKLPPGKTAIFTGGLYGGSDSAEILFLTSNTTTGDNQCPRGGPCESPPGVASNVNLSHETTGIYATPAGASVHKFNAPIAVGHHYTFQIIQHGNTADYTLTDHTSGAPPETYSAPTQLGANKSVRTGNEWWNMTGDAGPFAVRYDIRAASEPTYLRENLITKQLEAIPAGSSKQDQFIRGGASVSQPGFPSGAFNPPRPQPNPPGQEAVAPGG